MEMPFDGLDCGELTEKVLSNLRDTRSRPSLFIARVGAKFVEEDDRAASYTAKLCKHVVCQTKGTRRI